MEDKRISVIIVDDHRIFRVGLHSEIREMSIPVDIAAEVESAEQLFSLLPTTAADIVLLDIGLPGMSGVEAARKLRREYPAIKILVLSAENNNETISQLMQVGIDGFVNKSVPLGELQTAIEYLAQGAEYYGRDIARIMHCVRTARHDVDGNFTAREKQIIQLCAQGLTAKDIANVLNVSLKTVITHKYNIFKKMGINNCVELVNYALRTGIINVND